MSEKSWSIYTNIEYILARVCVYLRIVIARSSLLSVPDSRSLLYSHLFSRCFSRASCSSLASSSFNDYIPTYMNASVRLCTRAVMMPRALVMSRKKDWKRERPADKKRERRSKREDPFGEDPPRVTLILKYYLELYIFLSFYILPFLFLTRSLAFHSSHLDPAASCRAEAASRRGCVRTLAHLLFFSSFDIVFGLARVQYTYPPWEISFCGWGFVKKSLRKPLSCISHQFTSIVSWESIFLTNPPKRPFE